MRPVPLRLVLSAALCAALPACGGRSPAGAPLPAPTSGRYGGTTGGADAAAVQHARAEQNAALAAGDFARAAYFWAEDVTITAALGRVVRGRDAYRAALAAGDSIRYVRLPEHVEVSAAWPIAFERGVWEGRRAGASAGGAPLLGGAYAARWVKRDGRWLIQSEVFVAMRCSGRACAAPLAAPPP